MAMIRRAYWHRTRVYTWVYLVGMAAIVRDVVEWVL